MRAFNIAMLIAIGTTFALGGVANAQSNKPAHKPGVKTEKVLKTQKKTKTKKRNKVAKAGYKKQGTDLECFADALEHEPTQNLVGRVTAGHAILVRANQYGGICKAVHAPNQFTYTTKRAPSAETMRIAKEMYEDWKNGKATFEVATQRKVWGCSYFHDGSIAPPSWAVTFKKNGGFCGKYAGLYMYRDPGLPVQLAYK